ncbi:MAG: adenylate kinase [Phycisphaerae bacterium]
MRIVLMGPPGAGKGTQATRLVEKFGMTHLSSGDIFREVKSSGSDLGQKLAEYMDAGKLVPDEIVVEMMADAINKNDSESGLMLDGFPRTVPQAEALDEQLARDGKAMDAVVVIRANDDQIVERITGRRSCPECGKGFHVKFMPSEKGENCDECGAKLTQRSDDNEETVRQRLEAYYAQTEPVIDYYKTRSNVKVLEIDGTGTPDEVTAAMVDSLNGLKS